METGKQAECYAKYYIALRMSESAMSAGFVHHGCKVDVGANIRRLEAGGRSMNDADPLAATGPDVGDRFPDVRLPNQHGETIDLHASRGTRRAMIVFHRSALW